jgi:hypothetical protein
MQSSGATKLRMEGSSEEGESGKRRGGSLQGTEDTCLWYTVFAGKKGWYFGE